MAVAVITPLVFCFILFYALSSRSPLDQKSQDNSITGVRYSVLQDDVGYSVLNNNVEHSVLHDQEKKQEIHEVKTTEKFVIMWNMFMPMTYLFLQYFADDLSIQSNETPLEYPQKTIFTMGHFTYYSLAHNIGKLVGRVQFLVVSFTCSSLISHVQIKSTWILAAVGNALMFVLVFASWFRFLNELVAILIVMHFVMGFITGSIYANSALLAHQQTTDVSRREFALGILTLASSAGTFAAGLLGLFLEPYLTTHCLFELELARNCLPRFSYFSGWKKNIRC